MATESSEDYGGDDGDKELLKRLLANPETATLLKTLAKSIS